MARAAIPIPFGAVEFVVTFVVIQIPPEVSVVAVVPAFTPAIGHIALFFITGWRAAAVLRTVIFVLSGLAYTIAADDIT